MAEVTVLLQGYYLPGPPVRVCGSIVLVRDGALNILVDPGSVPDPGILAARLAQAGLTADDVGLVFLTHTHLDHCRSLGLFPKARVLDAWGWWEGDTWRAYDGAISPDTEVLGTPGHSDDGLTLLVHTAQARIAICGDLFFADTPVETKDPFAVNQPRLEVSRQTVLAAADFVIPGHGPMFAVRR